MSTIEFLKNIGMIPVNVNTKILMVHSSEDEQTVSEVKEITFDKKENVIYLKQK